MKQTPP